MRAASSSESGLSSGSPLRKKNATKKAVSSVSRRIEFLQNLTNTDVVFLQDVLSSSDCSDSNCSMCRFEKSAKEKRSKKVEKEKQKRPGPPPEPKLKPRAVLPHLPPPASSSRYAR